MDELDSCSTGGTGDQDGPNQTLLSGFPCLHSLGSALGLCPKLAYSGKDAELALLGRTFLQEGKREVVFFLLSLSLSLF